MNPRSRIWNGGLIVVLIGFGLFYPSEDAQNTERPATEIAKKESDPSPKVVSPSSGSTEKARAGRETKQPGSSMKRTNKEKLEAWKQVTAKHRDSIKARRIDTREKSQAIPKEKQRKLSEEQIRFWDARAEAIYAKRGFLHTLPADEQERITGKIRSLQHDLDYYPDSPNLYIELTEVLKEAQIPTNAYLTINYAAQKFPNDPQVQMTRAKLYHAYGYRAEAEQAYGRVLELTPGNKEAEGLLTKVKEEYTTYHSGQAKFGTPQLFPKK